jgi:type IV pilus assembly protein PilY1
LKSFTRKILTASLAALVCLARPGAAEDIDLFTSPPASAATAPNILIVLDNSANWSRNDQAWPVGKQGQAELYALRTLLNDSSTVNTNINLGLMMFGSGSPADGGYVRFHVRNMTDTNRAALRELIGTDTDPNFGGAACPAGNNSLNGTPNCILANYDTPREKVNSASTNYSGALMDVFKYFGGYTDPKHANTDTSPNPPNVLAWNKFGRQKYSVLDSKMDPASYTGSGANAQYKPPINADGSNSCAKNYVVFIGNGYPSSDADPSLLTGIFGDATVPPPIGNKSNRAANWAKYLSTTDVNELTGKQSVQIYTIDVFNAKPDANQTALLRAMAKFGGTGDRGYFEAKSQQAILDALKQIVVEIQSVNSVFASASLPINATNRTQNENQVFIGMFRPDPDANPRWYGNLKQYQVAMFGTGASASAQLADVNGNVAVSAATGFIQACATSFWTTDSGTYWNFSSPSAGSCTSTAFSPYSDSPDGGVVEKGGAAEFLRRGNGVGTTAPFTVNRTMLTCATAPCTGLVPFNTSSVAAADTGAASSTENTDIVNFTFGQDVNDENGDGNKTEPRPSIHNDIVHSRPLPINFGGSRGVELFYGTNDGAFRAVNGKTGKELWSFVAPEHKGKLKRLFKNSPFVAYPNLPVSLGATAKDYFFDGSSGVYQNADNSKVWIFPTMRRGGRMVYAFDISSSGSPVFKWSRGCSSVADDSNCTSGMSQIGLTFSTPQVAFIKGYNSGSSPVIIMGGGYDKCEDTDVAVTTCGGSNKGNVVYIFDANTGAVLASFATARAVPADVTLIDRDFDGKVDVAYVLDIGGSLYRIDFTDPATVNPRTQGAWTMTKIAQTSGSNRKFLFGPSALAAVDKIYLAFGSGDRERPLITNYPYRTPVQNRFYMFIDSFPSTGGVVDLDGGTLANFTTPTSCGTTLPDTSNGWFMDLTAGRGEQTVTSSVIFGGTIFFSTNRPITAAPGTCAPNLGEANGYALNLLNASGVIGTGTTCGGARSGIFTGGGIPPSPVVGTVPVKQADGTYKPIAVLIGGIDLQTGTGSPIGAQKPNVPIKQIRQRMYWYPEGDK